MTVSAQLGTLREVPDSASISLDSGTSLNGTSLKSNFRSVLEQYHASRESASETDDTQGATQQKQKDSDPTTTLAVPQPVTPAVEAPGLILPFTTSIALRQDPTSSRDETANPDATALSDDTTTLDSTAAAADRNAPSAAILTTSPTPTSLRGTLGLYSLPPVSDRKANRVTGGAQPTTPAKSQAKLQTKLADSVPPQTAAAPPAQTAPLDQTAPTDPSIPIRVTSSTTLEQAATGIQNSSTVSEAPYSVSTSTSDRAIAYQYRSSDERPTETAVSSLASQDQQKVSDPIPPVAAAIGVPIPLTNTMEPQPPTGSKVPPQNTRALDSGSTVPQDSSAASGTDRNIAMRPPVEGTDDTTAAPNAGALAFAARLTPTAESQAPAPESTRPAEPLPGSRTAPQLATPVTTKQIATGTDLPADAHSGESGGQSNKEKASDLFAKPETLVPQMHAAVADQTAIPANNHASTSPLSPAAHMDQAIDPPATTPKTNNDITVRIPDSTGQDTAVRFVERAGEIHVSVRTGDVELAQSLRGGLNDLTNHLEDGGIRTEVWQPGSASNGATSQSDSHQPFADPDGSNGRQYSSGSNSEQESKQQNKPRWVEELEGSIGNPNFKETTQLLWQA
jgi:hypothetical protein